MRKQRISVVIPTFNRSHLIVETLKSVLGQSPGPDEVIVVDDGSTDGTQEVIEKFDQSIKVLRQINQGAGAARNRGFKASSGDFIHFMDSDDLISSNTYEVQLQALERTGADMAYGPWVKTRLEKENCRTQPVVIQQAPLPSSIPMHEWILRGWITVFQPCLFRRRILEKAGPYRVDLKPSEDTEFLFRIGRCGAKLVHTPETLTVYRVHPEDQISSINVESRQLDWLRLLSILDLSCQNDKSISPATLRQYNLNKIASLTAIGNTLYPSLADKLWLDVPPSSLIVYRLTCLLRRFRARLRRGRFGDNYSRAFGVRPVAESHKRLMHKLGYEHIGFY